MGAIVGGQRGLGRRAGPRRQRGPGLALRRRRDADDAGRRRDRPGRRSSPHSSAGRRPAGDSIQATATVTDQLDVAGDKAYEAGHPGLHRDVAARRQEREVKVRYVNFWQLAAGSWLLRRSLPSPSLTPDRMTHRAPDASPYVEFTRAEWRRRRDKTPLTLSEAELERAPRRERSDLAGGRRGDLPAALAAALAARGRRAGAARDHGHLPRPAHARRCPTSSASRAASRWARAPSRDCCRPCSSAGPAIPRWTS